MSVETQYIIAGYVFIVVIIVGIMAFYVLTEIFMEIYRWWDKKQKERKRNESNRRKAL